MLDISITENSSDAADLKVSYCRGGGFPAYHLQIVDGGVNTLLEPPIKHSRKTHDEVARMIASWSEETVVASVGRGTIWITDEDIRYTGHEHAKQQAVAFWRGLRKIYAA